MLRVSLILPMVCICLLSSERSEATQQHADGRIWAQEWPLAGTSLPCKSVCTYPSELVIGVQRG
jgi:hypothetical protein